MSDLRRRLQPLVGLTAAALTCAVLANGCGDDDPDGGSASAASGPLPCKRLGQAPRYPDGGYEKPTERLDPSKRYDVIVRNNCNPFTIRLDVKRSPNATASFVHLVNEKFYESTMVHRIVADKLIQAGDQTNTGNGGPGYTTHDEVADVEYEPGTVLMVKPDGEPPGTAGGQFYVITGDDPGLEHEHAILGRVVDGMENVEKINAMRDPDDEDGPPRSPVVIDEMFAYIGEPGDPLPF
jgi:peptidyl-prolyl cis-trans isomerase B (cyclophilin B)